MSTEITKYDAGFKYTQDQINLIKSQIAKGATDDELSMFTMLAQKYGLDPFLKEIWFIKQAKKNQVNGKWEYKKNKDGSIDYTGADTLIYTSRDGYLKIAQRDEAFAGIISFAVREGDTFEIDAENYKVTHKFGAKRGNIIGAWAKVDHAHRKPVIVFVDFKEYYSEKSTTWKQYPTAMIIKVAEVFALKRQFGISGLVTREEISHSINDEAENDVPVNVVEVVEHEKPKQEITQPQIKRVYAMANEKNITEEMLKAWIDAKFKKNSMKELTKQEYEDLCNALEKTARFPKEEGVNTDECSADSQEQS